MEEMSNFGLSKVSGVCKGHQKTHHEQNRFTQTRSNRW